LTNINVGNLFCYFGRAPNESLRSAHDELRNSVPMKLHPPERDPGGRPWLMLASVLVASMRTSQWFRGYY